MHFLSAIIGDDSEVLLPVKCPVFERMEPVLQSQVEGGVNAYFPEAKPSWKYLGTRAAGERLHKGELAIMLPYDMPTPRDHIVPVPPDLLKPPPKPPSITFRDMLEGKAGPAAFRDATKCKVIDAQESKQDVLRYIAGLKEGKDEPYLVIVEDHRYGMGEESMGKTFISIPAAVREKAIAALKDAYIAVLHMLLDHYCEQLIGHEDVPLNPEQ